MLVKKLNRQNNEYLLGCGPKIKQINLQVAGRSIMSKASLIPADY